MRYSILPILATLIMLAWTSPAQARMARVCSERSPAALELACGRANLHHANSNLRFLDHHSNAGTRYSRNVLRRGMTWLQKYARYHIAHAQSRMVPPIPHRALWECLHPHEASDWHNQDTGHNGHYGGLQMTLNWLGIVPGNPASYSPTQQMLFAEQGYRQSGYSSKWLWGQWGQTLGFCTRYI